jgi:hypothetical protein
VRRLLVTANVVLSSPMFVTLMLEELHSSEMSLLTRAPRVTSQKTAFFTRRSVRKMRCASAGSLFCVVHVDVVKPLQIRSSSHVSRLGYCTGTHASLRTCISETPGRRLRPDTGYLIEMDLLAFFFNPIWECLNTVPLIPLRLSACKSHPIRY